jgi:hypothetical protein
MVTFIIAFFVFATSTQTSAAERELGAVVAVERTFSFDITECRANWIAESPRSGKCLVSTLPATDAGMVVNDRGPAIYTNAGTQVMMGANSTGYLFAVSQQNSAEARLTFDLAEPTIRQALMARPDLAQARVTVFKVR